MATEKLKFKLELWATMWSKPPHVEVQVNEAERFITYFDKEISSTIEKPTVIEFEHECDSNYKDGYCLRLKRSGKDIGQTIVDNDGKILKDQCLHIKSLEIDEINLGDLIYRGVYTPNYPEPWYSQQKSLGKEPPDTIDNCDTMGHDGKWEFKFESPFYMWLLENLY